MDFAAASRGIEKNGISWLRARPDEEKERILYFWENLSLRAINILKKDLANSIQLSNGEWKAYSAMQRKAEDDGKEGPVGTAAVGECLAKLETLLQREIAALLETYKALERPYRKPTRWELADARSIGPITVNLIIRKLGLKTCPERRAEVLDAAVAAAAENGGVLPKKRRAICDKLMISRCVAKGHLRHLDRNVLEDMRKSNWVAPKNAATPLSWKEREDNDNAYFRRAYRMLERPYCKPTMDELIAGTGWSKQRVELVKQRLGMSAGRESVAEKSDAVADAILKRGGKIPHRYVLLKMTKLSEYDLSVYLAKMESSGTFAPERKPSISARRAVISGDQYVLAARMMVSGLVTTERRLRILNCVAEGEDDAANISRTLKAKKRRVAEGLQWLETAGLVWNDGKGLKITGRGSEVLTAAKAFQLRKSNHLNLDALFRSGGDRLCPQLLNLAELQESIQKERNPPWITYGTARDAELYAPQADALCRLTRMGVVKREQAQWPVFRSYNCSHQLKAVAKIPFEKIMETVPFKQHCSSKDRAEVYGLLEEYNVSLAARRVITNPQRLAIAWCIANGIFHPRAIMRKTKVNYHEIWRATEALGRSDLAWKRLPGIMIDMERPRAKLLVGYLRVLEGIIAKELTQRAEAGEAGLGFEVPEEKYGHAVLGVLPLPAPLELAKPEPQVNTPHKTVRKEAVKDKIGDYITALESGTAPDHGAIPDEKEIRELLRRFGKLQLERKVSAYITLAERLPILTGKEIPLALALIDEMNGDVNTKLAYSAAGAHMRLATYAMGKE